jgi:SAM-dependent methyltransferase
MVLEVDCGPGVLAAKLRDKGAIVTATDLSFVAVERARAKGIPCTQLDIDSQPLPLPIASSMWWCPIPQSSIASSMKRPSTNCVRVLKPGGRLMVSDIVLLKELPEFIRNSIDAYIGCVSGAMKKNEYLKAIRKSGFEAVKVVDESTFPLDCVVSDPLAKAAVDDLKMTQEQIVDIASSIASVSVQGLKPAPIK